MFEYFIIRHPNIDVDLLCSLFWSVCLSVCWCSCCMVFFLYVRVQELWSNRTWIDFLFLYSFWQDPTIDPYLKGSVNISLNSAWFHTVSLCAVWIPCWRCSARGVTWWQIMTYTCTLTLGNLPNHFSIFVELHAIE